MYLSSQIVSFYDDDDDHSDDDNDDDDDDDDDNDINGDGIASAAADEGPAFIPLDSPGSQRSCRQWFAPF